MSETLTKLKHYKMYINGEFKDSTSGKLLTVINPSTGEQISTVPSATREETQEAIDDAYGSKDLENGFPQQLEDNIYMIWQLRFETRRII